MPAKPLIALTVVLALVVGAIGVLRAQSQSAEALTSSTIYGIAYDTISSNGGPAVLYKIDPRTGRATVVGDTGYVGISGIDFDPRNGTLYGVGRRESTDKTYLLKISTATGRATEIGPIGGPTDDAHISDLSFRNSDSMLFAWNEYSPNRGLSTFNLNTGQITYIGEVINGDGKAIAFDGKDMRFFARFNNPIETNLEKLNTRTGSPTFVAHLAPLPDEIRSPNAMDFKPGTTTLYASLATTHDDEQQRYLATINTKTGQITLIGKTVDGLDAIAFADGDAGSCTDCNGDNRDRRRRP